MDTVIRCNGYDGEDSYDDYDDEELDDGETTRVIIPTSMLIHMGSLA